MSKIDVLAFDLGASNGRAIVGHLDDKIITTTEVHRFANNFVTLNGVDCWDINNLFENLKLGFQKAFEMGFKPQSFGIDTWGVDYGLLDEKGELIANPRAYRGSKDEAMNDAIAKIGKRNIFNRTGIATLNFNTIYQLNQRVLENDEELTKAKTLLLMPDLLGYLFTGQIFSEYTNVTTSNLFNVETKNWDFELINKLNIPSHIFSEIDYPGHVRGNIKKNIAEELGIDSIPLIAVGTHDTASAVAAIPLNENYAFCSSGTWSLCGLEAEKAIINDLVYNSNFSNEGTIQGGVRPLKNIMGMWIIQECRRQWGENLSWKEIDKETTATKSLGSIINPNYSDFFKAGHMIEKIQDYCHRTGQAIPKTIGEISRTVYESLALMYRNVIETLSDLQGAPIQGLNITGGGIKNVFVDQMTADCIGLPVLTGPTEGAALGNIMAQLIGLQKVKDVHEGREIISQSIEMKKFEPKDRSGWDQQYQKLLTFLEADNN